MSALSEAPFLLDSPGTAQCCGAPRFVDSELQSLANAQGVSAAWIEAFTRHGVDAPKRAHGEFSVGVMDRHGRSYLAVDRFSVRPLCFRLTPRGLCFHTRADVVAGEDAALDAQAIFNYLYFHVIPAPRTIFRDVQRIPAGHCVSLTSGHLDTVRWWVPVFDEDRPQPFAALREEFRRLLREAISRQLDGSNVGCFLSGGTDSSTVAGVLTELTGRPARTFSIGFDATGYDEMEYARIAARHFRSEHHEYYVTPADLVASIPTVAQSYDQPFGNSSVVPAYHCARIAKHAGVEKILGGDGGDELFGGNSRYAKQRIFETYSLLPAPLRRSVLEPLLGAPSPFGRLPIARKAASYVEQARVPMPDRLQIYNLIWRIGLQEVLDPGFLASIDMDEPLRDQREVYALAAHTTLINRMLHFDWRYTLADNDLPKVVGATSLADIRAGFPLLDDALTDFSIRLAPEMKLRGLKLRWFFKEALRGFLPDEVLAKKKHGFGLPFGVWANRNPQLKSLAAESIRALAQRGIVRTDYVERLLTEQLPSHAGYYGEMVWILMMLEQWLRGRSQQTHQHVPSPLRFGTKGL